MAVIKFLLDQAHFSASGLVSIELNADAVDPLSQLRAAGRPRFDRPVSIPCVPAPPSAAASLDVAASPARLGGDAS